MTNIKFKNKSNEFQAKHLKQSNNFFEFKYICAKLFYYLVNLKVKQYAIKKKYWIDIYRLQKI